MKLMHTTTTTLNTKEFNKVSDKISDALYALNPDIQDLYDIHINYIDDSWHIDFIPTQSKIPALKVMGYVDYSGDNSEMLKIHPQDLTDFPKAIKLGTDTRAYDLCAYYVTIFEFILSLYDFEYKL